MIDSERAEIILQRGREEICRELHMQCGREGDM